MIIPNYLKIGGVTYNVIVTDEWPGREDGDFGETFNDLKRGNTIYIYSGLTPEAKEITLIHEALHAMNTTMHHEFLDSLSTQIHQFFCDNGFLIR